MAYIPYSGAYVTPDALQKLGLKQTTTPGGGTGYADASGQVYTFNGSGFQSVTAPAQPQQTQQTPQQQSQPPAQSQQQAPANDNTVRFTSGTGGNGGGIQKFTYNGQEYSVPVAYGQSLTPQQALAAAGINTQQQATQPPNVNLKPGDNNTNVTQLQNWLIQQGYSIPAGATGYYGDQTKAAVAKWQAASGIDAQGNAGYFGPLSRNYIQTQAQAQNQSGTGTGNGSGTQSGTPNIPSGTGTPFDPNTYGISQNDWNNLGSGGQAFVQSLTNFLQGQYDQGLANVSINADLLNKAMTAAQSDPDIKAKYGDSLSLAQADLQKNLSLINQNYGQQLTQEEQVAQQQQKDLSNQQAAAGKAYSGFRAQAKQLLDTQQSGIIQSTKSQLQSSLNQLGSSLEGQFGTQALQNKFAPISAVGQNYSAAGNITGSQPLAQKADVFNKGLSIYDSEKLPT